MALRSVAGRRFILSDGQYAHSFGLEGLAQEGVVRDRETLKHFFFCRSCRRFDGPSCRWRRMPGARLRRPDWARVGEISLLSSALKTAAEARAAAGNIGRQRAELAASLREHPLAVEYLRRPRRGLAFSPAISAALEGRVTGAP